MYSSGPLQMDEQRQNVQLEPTYSNSVLILDVALKTCQKQWTIGTGGERGSEISMLIVRHDNDDDIYMRVSLKVHRLDKWSLFFNIASTSLAIHTCSSGLQCSDSTCQKIINMKSAYELFSPVVCVCVYIHIYIYINVFFDQQICWK